MQVKTLSFLLKPIHQKANISGAEFKEGCKAKVNIVQSSFWHTLDEI